MLALVQGVAVRHLRRHELFKFFFHAKGYAAVNIIARFSVFYSEVFHALAHLALGLFAALCVFHRQLHVHTMWKWTLGVPTI